MYIRSQTQTSARSMNSPCMVARRQHKCSAMLLPIVKLIRRKLRRERPGRESDVTTSGTTQIRHIQERMPADETQTPAAIEHREEAAAKPTAHADAAQAAESKGTIPSGTYVALLESRCPLCQHCLIDGMFSCMRCGSILLSSKRSERSLRVYQQRADCLSRVSSEANVRINADSLLSHWRGDDMDDRAFRTWESEQLRKGRQRLNRSMKMGFYNMLHRYRRDNVFATSLASINRDVTDCILYDTYAVLRLAGVERSAGQRAIDTGPMDKINKHDRFHVAKSCFVTVPSRLLHDEFRDPLGGSSMVFWHQKLFKLTRFVQALRRAKFDVITMLTYSSYDQGIADFQLEGLDDRQRRDLFLNSFDEDLYKLPQRSTMSPNRIPGERGNQMPCWGVLSSSERTNPLHHQTRHLSKPFAVTMFARHPRMQGLLQRNQMVLHQGFACVLLNLLSLPT